MGFDSAGPSQAPLVVRRPDDTDCSTLASTPLVSGPSGSGNGLAARPPSLSRSSQTAAPPSSSSRGPQAVASCVETIQRFARAAGFSTSVAAQVGLARRLSSHTNYELKWSVYQDWCRKEGHSVSHPSLPKVADFLSWLRHSKDLLVSSILGYRSMLSAVFRSVLPAISSDLVLKNLIRSFKVEAPPRPLRPLAWDLSMVLRYLSSSSFEPLHLSSLRNLTKKVLFLVTLATAKHIGELQAISKTVSFVRSDVYLSYVPEFVAKMESFSNPLPRSFLVKSLSDFAAGLEEDLLLCSVRALQIYLQHTDSFSSRPLRLFVSPRRPSHSLSKNAVSFFLGK